MRTFVAYGAFFALLAITSGCADGTPAAAPSSIDLSLPASIASPQRPTAAEPPSRGTAPSPPAQTAVPTQAAEPVRAPASGNAAAPAGEASPQGAATQSSSASTAWCRATARVYNAALQWNDVYVHSNRPSANATASADDYSWSQETNGSGYALIYLDGPPPGAEITVQVGGATCTAHD